MMPEMVYPNSYPNAEEENFLRLVLCSDQEFPTRFQEWKQQTVFNDIDHATMRLLPLLHLRLQSLNIHDELAGRIKGVYRYAWCKNQQLLETARQSIEHLSAENIPTMLLKGIALLQTVYQNSGSRFTGDVDILVQPGDAIRAMEILKSHCGVLKKLFFPSTNRLSSKTIFEQFNEVSFEAAHDTEIDLHWDVFADAKRMSTAAVWEQAVPFQLSNQRAYIPCPEDMLIHVILHGAEYNDHRALRWVLDAMAILQHTNMDWHRLLARTRVHDCAIEMQTACSYLMHRFNLHVPESFVCELKQIPVTPLMKNRFLRAGNLRPFHPIKQFLRLRRLYRSEPAACSVSFFTFVLQQYDMKQKHEVIKRLVEKIRTSIASQKRSA